uniref:Uncharacterized protein n=1 Tax=Echinococcus granulosus TaxID=6210 RepID=U6FT63_ECHGR|nr:hypothetical protein EgrG_002056000 [Echinococcus granulosus]
MGVYQNSPVFTTQELGHRESEVYACVSGSDGANLATAVRDASRSRVRQVNGSIFFDLLQPDHSSQLLHQCMMDRKPPINSLLGVAFSQPPPHAHRNALVRPGDSNYSIADTDKTFAVWLSNEEEENTSKLMASSSSWRQTYVSMVAKCCLEETVAMSDLVYHAQSDDITTMDWLEVHSLAYPQPPSVCPSANLPPRCAADLLRIPMLD